MAFMTTVISILRSKLELFLIRFYYQAYKAFSRFTYYYFA